MKKFLSLPVEKQNIIINAALIAFGADGYKKASVSDIAIAAGISKAMVFHYFGTKKSLYLYLINLCGSILMNEVDREFNNAITDFFDRIKLAANIEISIMENHPAIFSFLNSVYFENDSEVKEDIESIFSGAESFRSKIAFDGMDASKFKDSIDPKLVMKMLTWITEGLICKSPGKAGFDIEVLRREFNECIALLKNNLYKEEYL